MWGRTHTCFEDWANREPESLFILRRAIGVASSWTFLRFQQSYMCYPWLLAGLVDPRRSSPDKRLVAEAFVEAPVETLDLWFGNELRDRIEDADDLMSGSWQSALWLWSWQVLCTIAQAEFQHGRNRRRAHEHDLWSNFVAKSFNSEAALRLQRHHRAFADLSRSAGPQQHGLPDEQPEKSKRSKKKAPFDVYKSELIVARKSSGFKTSVTSRTFWEECRKGWSDIQQCPERVQRYEAEAALANMPHPSEVPPVPNAPAAQPPHRACGQPGAEAKKALPAPIDLTGFAAAPASEHTNVLDMNLKCPLDPRGPCPLPVNPEKLQCILEASGENKTKQSFTSMQSQFNVLNSSFGMKRVPIVAKQPRPPRWFATPAGMHKFREQLEKHLQAFCLKCLPKGASSAHSANLCLQIDAVFADAFGKSLEERGRWWVVALSGNA